MLNHKKTVNSQKASKSYKKKCLYDSIPYRLQPYHKHNKYLHVQLDTCSDVNLMPKSVYKLVFNDPNTSKLAKSDINFTLYTRHSVDLISKNTFFMLSKDTKQPVEVDFYIAKDDGSVLSHETVFQIQLLDVKPRLEYLPPRVTLISSAAEYPRKEVHAQARSIKQQYSTEAAHSGSISAKSGSIITQNGPIMQQEDTAKKIKIVKSKEQIKELYPELFEGIGRFPGEPYHIHTDPSVTPKDTGTNH